MYQTRPDDYDAFRCIAGACPQTCCAAWEIVVDPDAQDAYLRLRHPLAQKLRRVMRVDADGDTYFAQSDGCCPFLCADGLCELQRTLGVQSLCRTCRDFPRWEVLLCDRVEQGLSLACPAAALRLLDCLAAVSGRTDAQLVVCVMRETENDPDALPRLRAGLQNTAKL